jgi:uncharacterized glyoxalase superfamily protein PhnB
MMGGTSAVAVPARCVPATVAHRYSYPPRTKQDSMATSPSVTLCGAATLFVVQDVLRSVSHYCDVLGFHSEFTYGEPTFYAGLERDGVVIHLQAADRTKRLPGHGAVNIFVSNVDALYQEFKSRGARILSEPKDYPYGMRDFDVNDLDRNQLCFGMESKQQPTKK